VGIKIADRSFPSKVQTVFIFRYISIVTLASMAVQGFSSQYYPTAIRDNLGLTYPTTVSRRLERPQWFPDS
jgi:hypothetical protein